jgi:hypothetical protein
MRYFTGRFLQTGQFISCHLKSLKAAVIAAYPSLTNSSYRCFDTPTFPSFKRMYV